jgi:hypothetical protein
MAEPYPQRLPAIDQLLGLAEAMVAGRRVELHSRDAGGEATLRAGRDLVVVSVGALGDARRHDALLAAALLVLLALVQFSGRPKPVASPVPAVVPQAALRSLFEPGPADDGIGKPFVITSEGRRPYDGKAYIAIARRIHGTPQLIVEAFEQ